ncbi:general odorant-binding protein 69a-like [Culicoides brevitarsis]|uniref:general odorant-binding protein 69a-like n=1 Tax=Culicoides brevitarsis TaxID=469753 RepID=UPI00307B9F43
MFLKSLTLFFIIGATFGFEIPESIQSGLEKVHRDCMEKTQATLDHIHKCSDKAIPDDPDAKCYLACFHDQLAFDLKNRIFQIQNVDHPMNDDVHGLLDHVSKECDGAYFV